MKRYLFRSGLLFAVALGLASCKGSSTSTPDDELLADETELTEEQTADELLPDASEELAEAVTLGRMTPVYDKDSKTYTLKVVVRKAPKDAKLQYALLKTADGTPFMESEEAVLKGIAPSESQVASYFVKVSGTVGSTTIAPVLQEVTGFGVVKEVEQKMTATELQELIDQKSASAMDHPSIAPQVKIAYTGLAADDVKPETLADVVNNLKMDIWTKATVSNVGYDDMGRINSVTIAVEF